MKFTLTTALPRDTPRKPTEPNCGAAYACYKQRMQKNRGSRPKAILASRGTVEQGTAVSRKYKLEGPLTNFTVRLYPRMIPQTNASVFASAGLAWHPLHVKFEGNLMPKETL